MMAMASARATAYEDSSWFFIEETGAVRSRLVGSHEGDGIRASFSVDEWPSPAHVTGRSEYHTVICHFPRKFFEGGVRCAGMRSEHAREVGSIFFRPANLGLIGVGSGGIHNVARFYFTPERFTRTIQDDFHLQEDAVFRGLDLAYARLSSTLTWLHEEMINPGLANSAVFEAGMMIVMIELARHLNGEGTAAETRVDLSPTQFTRITDRLNANDLPVPSVTELAQLVGISQRHLLRLFKARTGMGVSTFIERAQSDRARTMLDNSDLAIKQIAFRLGFASASSFTTAFRKTTGETPGQYRKRALRRPFCDEI